MGCNCGKGLTSAPAGQEFVVLTKDGTEHTGFETKIQANVAAAKLGGVVKTRDVK